MTPTPRDPRLYWLLQLLGWGAYGTVGWVINGVFVEAVNVRAIGLSYSGATILLLLTHGFRAYLRSHDWLRKSPRQLVPRVLLATLLMAVVSQLLVSVLMVWVFDLLGDQTYSLFVLGMYIFQTQVILLLWSLAYLVFHFFLRYRQEEIEKWRFATAAREAELEALLAQINPHFIFNCLNNIRALVREDPERARTAITRLSDLLRSSIQPHHEAVVSLARELKVVDDYLTLEQIQFEERLRFAVEVSDAARAAQVPVMVVQLLVENAIKHGISRLPDGGEIRVVGRVEAGELCIEVSNTGELRPVSESASGVGLRNARERLRSLFGENATLALEVEGSGRIVARLRLPYQVFQDTP